MDGLRILSCESIYKLGVKVSNLKLLCTVLESRGTHCFGPLLKAQASEACGLKLCRFGRNT